METNKMATMPMPRLVVNMSLPLMISLLVQSLYNIVDSIFVAGLSEEALTAVSLGFPVQLLMIAVSVGTSVGINALLSQNIGAGKKEAVTNIAVTGVLLSLAGTLVFLALGLTCVNFYVAFFTGDPVIAGYAGRYLRICMLFCLGTFIGTMYQRFLQAIGNTFDSMLSLIAGAVTNLILDPVMIFGLFGCPAMDVSGAAIATVIGQWVAALTAVLLNRLKNPVVKVKFSGYRCSMQILKGIYRVGLPTIVTQALGSVMLFCVNAILIRFSSTAVAFFGVYYKLQSFLFMPMNGLGQAAIPIAGYNYGAKHYERVRGVIRTMVPAAVVISLAATAVFLCVPGLLLDFFSAGDAMRELGIPALRVISVTFAFASVTMVLGYTVSGLGNGMVNMVGTALRQVLLLVPLMYLLAHAAGISAVWYAFLVSETAACAYAVAATGHELKKRGI